jgi:hypothetical protein
VATADVLDQGVFGAYGYAKDDLPAEAGRGSRAVRRTNTN